MTATREDGEEEGIMKSLFHLLSFLFVACILLPVYLLLGSHLYQQFLLSPPSKQAHKKKRKGKGEREAERIIYRLMHR